MTCRSSGTGLYYAIVNRLWFPNSRLSESVWLPVLFTAFAATAPAQTPSPIGDAAYPTLLSRASAAQSAFYVYRNADDALNHGFPSGLFPAGATGQITTNPACVDDPDSPSGCATSVLAYDCTRGTVFQMSFSPFAPNGYAGLNFEEPNGYSMTPYGVGYNLTGAEQVSFDVRSPTGITVQFGVAGHVTQFVSIPPSSTYTTLTFNLSTDLGLQAADLTSPHTLFEIVTNVSNAPQGGILLLDNIQFTPVPTRQQAVPSLPVGTQVCGVIPVTTELPAPYNVPPDQLSVNAAPIYEASLSLLSLLRRPTQANLTAAQKIADALVYALMHDNRGLPLPSNGSTVSGLHSAYEGGDLPLNNDQTAQPQPGVPYAHAGDSRLAGFTGGETLCGSSGFCLVLDGATTGNTSFAVLGLLAAFRQFQKPSYLAAATAIGNWISTFLADTSSVGVNGYYNGYNDGGALASGVSAAFNKGKSTENNADAFAAFSALATIATEQQEPAQAAMWKANAMLAGDFVVQMLDSNTGCFNAGTVPTGTQPGAGVQPTGPTIGTDTIDTYQFLDANSFAILSLGISGQYSQVDWHRPMQCILQNFQATASANDQSFQGFDLITPALAPAKGIAWEFTGQTVVALNTVDLIYGESLLAQTALNYLGQIRQAQTAAPFTDQSGLPAATLDGDETRPWYQCLPQALQCVPERLGLAATNWAINAESSFNPFRIPPTVLPGGVVNSASFQAAPNNLISSGTLLAIFGDSLAATNATAQFVNGSLPTVLNGTAVLLNGDCAPLISVSPAQINVQAVAGLPASGSAALSVSTGVIGDDCTTGNPGISQPVPLAVASPGLYVVDSKTGNVAAVHRDGTLVSPSSPAVPGETILLFGTGFGPVSLPVNAGQQDPGIDQVLGTMTFTIGGITLTPAEILYAGLAPTFAGLYQFNVTIPNAVAPGNAMVVACTLGACSQSGVILPID